MVILIEVGKALGLGGTLALVIATGILGAWLARWQGLRQLRLIQGELQQGKMPAPQLVDGVLILVAGIVLLTPGLITDACGFFLLIPPGRAVVRTWLKQVFRKQMKSGTIDVTSWEE